MAMPSSDKLPPIGLGGNTMRLKVNAAAGNRIERVLVERGLVALLLLAMLAALAPKVFAVELSGTWRGSFDLQGAEVPVVVHLQGAGELLSGTLERPGAAAAELRQCKVEGANVSFQLSADYQGVSYRLVFRGKAEGDALQGELATDDGQWSSPLRLKRSVEAAQTAAIDVSGNWRGSFDVQGSTVPVAIRLKAEAEALSGTVEGLQNSPAAIEQGTLSHDQIQFRVKTVYQGASYTLVFKGRVKAGSILFELGTDDGQWATTLTVNRGV